MLAGCLAGKTTLTAITFSSFLLALPRAGIFIKDVQASKLWNLKEFIYANLLVVGRFGLVWLA